MFSTSQQDMTKSLTSSYFENGFKYYIVHTNTKLDDSYNNYNFYDLTFYFSKSPINVNNNKFTFSGDVIKINAISRNVSTSNNDNKLNRMNVSTFNGSSVTVPIYEHIYTNADGQIYMNLLSEKEYDINHNFGYQFDFNDYLIIPVILCILVLLIWLRSWFGKNYKR